MTKKTSRRKGVGMPAGPASKKAKPKKKKPPTPTSSAVPPAPVKSGIGSAGPPGSATGAAAIESLRRTVRQFKADVRTEFQGVASDIQKLREQIRMFLVAPDAEPTAEPRPVESAGEEDHPSIEGGLDAAHDDDYHGRSL